MCQTLERLFDQKILQMPKEVCIQGTALGFSPPRPPGFGPANCIGKVAGFHVDKKLLSIECRGHILNKAFPPPEKKSCMKPCVCVCMYVGTLFFALGNSGGSLSEGEERSRRF